MTDISLGNGSTIRIDEPPDRGHYRELERRASRTRGDLTIALTPVSTAEPIRVGKKGTALPPSVVTRLVLLGQQHPQHPGRLGIDVVRGGYITVLEGDWPGDVDGDAVVRNGDGTVSVRPEPLD